jgi:hypothetical protein
MIEYLKVFGCERGTATNKTQKSGDLAVGVSYQETGIDSNDKNRAMGRG